MTTAHPLSARVRMRFDPDEAMPAPRTEVRVRPAPIDRTRPRVLHVGCGPAGPNKLHRIFRGDAWREIRLDIDPGVDPDIRASITDLGEVEEGSCDAIWCSHNLEHLCAHEVPRALAEFRRVLAPTGFALIRSPDLTAVAEIVLSHGLDHVVYRSPAGPVTAADMLYGHGTSIARGNSYMRHGTGFTRESLATALEAAGFASALTARTADYTVWGAGFMAEAAVPRIRRALERTGLSLAEIVPAGSAS